MKLETLHWEGGVDGHLCLIDQTALPVECRELICDDVTAVWEAIKTLRIRGAPAIGIAAAYGVVLGTRHLGEAEASAFLAGLRQSVDYLASSRPTAVNLFWALERMHTRALALGDTMAPREIVAALLDEARAIHEEDRQMCRAIGRHGAALMPDEGGVLTHCNAGGLATADYGTALAVIYSAIEQGKQLHIYADETRPLLQGARLTAWELTERGIPATLICDSMAAHVMQIGRVQAVVTGADRIAANGDTANKIGTYGVALAAAAHGIPFYIAAPSNTFDLNMASGAEIPIEQRDPTEITYSFGRQTAPDGVGVYNPAFDVTPAKLIRAIICERGVIAPVTEANIRRMLGPQKG